MSVCQSPPLLHLVVLHLLSDGVSKQHGLVKTSSCIPHLKLLGGFRVAPPSRHEYSERVRLCPAAMSLPSPACLLVGLWQSQPLRRLGSNLEGLWFSGSWLSVWQGVRSPGQGTAAKQPLPSHLGEGWQRQSRTDAKVLNGECFKMLLRPHLDVTTTWGLLLVAGDSICLVKA